MGRIAILNELAAYVYKMENVVSFCAWQRKYIVLVKLPILLKD